MAGHSVRTSARVSGRTSSRKSAANSSMRGKKKHGKGSDAAWKHSPLVGTILVATLCGLVITGMFPEKCDADVLIVLGCLVDGENPSLSLLYRLNAAERYLKEHPDAVCILSGGQGDREDITEALCMYRVLTGRGIAPSRLYLEERSTNTFENLRYSREVMAENGIEGSICLVTNSFHLYRARIIAGRQGMTCGGLAASSHLLTLPLYIFREAAGIMWLTVFGYE